MGVQADTATATAGTLDQGADGFTAGDAQQGNAPTQVSGTFLNTVIDEINNAIVTVGKDGVSLAFDTFNQLARAIEKRIAFQDGPPLVDAFGNPTWYRRTFDALTSSVEHKWRTWFKNSYRVAAAQASAPILAPITVADNSAFWATFEVVVVRTNLVTTRQGVILRAFCARNGGSCTIDAVTTAASSGALGATFAVVATTDVYGDPAVAVQVTLPASPGNTFNIACSAHASNVTTGT